MSYDNNVKIEFFNPNLIHDLWHSRNSETLLQEHIFEYFRRQTGKINLEETYVNTVVEFCMYNLVFLKKTLTNVNSEEDRQTIELKIKFEDLNEFDKMKNLLISDLLNSISSLIKLEDKAIIDSNIKIDMNKNDKVLSGNESMDNSMNMSLNINSGNQMGMGISDENIKSKYKNFNSKTIINSFNHELLKKKNFLTLSKEKLTYLKDELNDIYHKYKKENIFLIIRKLFYSKAVQEEKVIESKDNKDKKNLQNKPKDVKNAPVQIFVDFEKLEEEAKIKYSDFFTKDHIAKILIYLNENFFPFLKLFYIFNNVERDERIEKMEFILNKPIETFSLNSSTSFIDDREEMIKLEKEKEIQKQKEKEEKDKEVNLKTESNLKTKENVVLTEKNLKHEKTYIDLLNELNLSEDAKNLIKEAVENMHAEIKSKVDEREKRLHEKLKDIEDLIKGKKK